MPYNKTPGPDGFPAEFFKEKKTLQATYIRQSRDKRLQIKKKHQIILYADNVLLFLQNTQASLSKAVALVN